LCALTIPGEPAKLLSWPKPHLFLPEKWNKQSLGNDSKHPGNMLATSSNIMRNAHTEEG
jgi:hypothetical protein